MVEDREEGPKHTNLYLERQFGRREREGSDLKKEQHRERGGGER